MAFDPCPDVNPDTLSPCTCYVIPSTTGRAIECSGDSNVNLTDIFGRLSRDLSGKDKHFQQFMLRNTRVVEFPENVFSDIQFVQIQVIRASSFRRIHERALIGTGSSLSSINFEDTPIDNGQDNYDLFKVIQGLTSLQVLVIANTSLTNIPTNGLRNHPALAKVAIIYNDKLEVIGSNVFNNLSRLVNLNLGNNKLTNIAEYAFAMSQVNDTNDFHLKLIGNALNHTMISGKAFEGINRPVVLFLNNDGYNYIPEPTYEVFVKQNTGNIIISDTDCTDPGNDWLRTGYPLQWVDRNCNHTAGHKI